MTTKKLTNLINNIKHLEPSVIITTSLTGTKVNVNILSPNSNSPIVRLQRKFSKPAFKEFMVYKSGKLLNLIFDYNLIKD